MTEPKTEPKNQPPRYPGGALIQAASGVVRDALTVLLDPAKLYTSDEAASILKKFMEKEAEPNGRRNMDHTK